MNDVEDKKSWGHIVSSINRYLHPSESVTLEQLAGSAELTESTVRNFLPFTNYRELILGGVAHYMLNSEPKKIKNKQAVLLTMKTEKLFNDKEWMSTPSIKDRIRQVFPSIDAEKACQQMWAMHNEGLIDKKGIRPNYEYKLLDNPAKRIASSKISYTEQILEIANVVERMECKNRELEEENTRLQKKVALYERNAKAVLDM